MLINANPQQLDTASVQVWCLIPHGYGYVLLHYGSCQLFLFPPTAREAFRMRSSSSLTHRHAYLRLISSQLGCTGCLI